MSRQNISTGGEARLRWRQGDEFWPVSKSRERFHRPDIVRLILSGKEAG